MKVAQKQILAFQKDILDWFDKNKRDLPWRRPSLKLRNGLRDPYAILVSEVMLQQTQVSRVISKYEAWMVKFPTIQSLANASTRDVLFYWSGLGYNRRALYLKKLAEEVVKNYSGVFSQDEKELQKLPGIGEYTARALLCFAFDKQVAVVDTNVKKVIITFLKRNVLGVRSRGDEQALTSKEIQQIADQLLPKGRAYEWNQALMDYASAMLKKEKILIPKQSSFKTSNRFYRGQVLRLLLKKEESLDTLFARIENNGIAKQAFEILIVQMEKEGLLFRKGNVLFLPVE